MDDLSKFNECLKDLRTAKRSTTGPSFSELYQRLIEMQENVNMQIIEKKSAILEAKEVRDEMTEEVTTVLNVCRPQLLPDFRALNSKRPLASSGTPMSQRKRLNPEASMLAQSMIERDERRRTPLRKTLLQRLTPLSNGKLVLQHKFAPRCTPVSVRKGVIANVKRKSLTYLDATPELPKSRRSKLPPRETTARVTFASNTSVSISKPIDNPPPLTSSAVGKQTTLDRPHPHPQPKSLNSLEPSTPAMEKRVSFFSNPNVGNIHKRYVAIQDSNAEESTCLLTRLPNRSSTPPLPVSSQKPKFKTPTTDVTPPLPRSSVKKKPVKSTPDKPVDATPGRISKTPSPPKPRKHVRRCLDEKLEEASKEPLKLDRTPTLILRSRQMPRQPLATVNANAGSQGLSMPQGQIEVTAPSRGVFGVPKKSEPHTALLKSENQTASLQNVGFSTSVDDCQTSVLRGEGHTSSLRPSKMLQQRRN